MLNAIGRGGLPQTNAKVNVVNTPSVILPFDIITAYHELLSRPQVCAICQTKYLCIADRHHLNRIPDDVLNEKMNTMAQKHFARRIDASSCTNTTPTFWSSRNVRYANIACAFIHVAITIITLRCTARAAT